MLQAVLFLGASGLAIGAVLAVAAKRFQVETDPRVDQVLALLPGANCGACGFPGCSGLAQAIVEGRAPVDACKAVDKTFADGIADIMGVVAPTVEPQVAVVMCQGGAEVAARVVDYHGLEDCQALNALGGNNGCPFGCLGLGSCVKACPFGALEMGEDGLPRVIKEKCTGCGACVKACPRGVIKLVAKKQEVHVRCSSYDRGALVRGYCKSGCIACQICVRSCPSGAITMERGTLAVIDPSLCTNCGVCVEKCPVKTIQKEKGRFGEVA